MDRLIALLRLRTTLELRAVFGARSRLVSLLLALPALGVMSVGGAFVGFAAVRLLGRGHPELLLPGLSVLGGLLGLSWALSPLLAGVVATETHDLGRLLHFPVPVSTLVASSLLANLGQPMVLAQLPALAAVALALGRGPSVALAFGGLLLAFALALAAGQAVGLVLHAIARHRRWHDRALVLGIGTSLAIGVVPILLLSSGGGFARRLLSALLAFDVSVFLPFSWGVRAAVHAGRGEPLAFAFWTAAAALAVAGAVGVSGVLAGRLYRGALDLGEAPARLGRRATMPLPGAVGALLEKDLRVAWRDPRLKTLMLTGLVGPVLILVLVWQGTASVGPGLVLALASFTAAGIVGANVFAVERQALALLFGFPVARSSILIAKNLGSMLLRLPALLLVAAATLLVAGPVFVPAAVTIVLLTELVGCGLDNYVALFLPVPVAAAGGDPNAPASGTRGLGSSLVALAALCASLLLSAPFAFLVWLPYLLGAFWLWLATLPLALAGTIGIYFMLVMGAARLLERREPDLVAAVAFGA